ncbi:restriction endonuclease subunit S [Limosilactobacillus balticus]|uniref:restriction endonuclease subunit S n=1 Tax=Limosilactobacillus balticus TaxID=2759747 RepID=UPI0039922DB5
MFFSVLSIIFIKVRINVKWEQHKLKTVVSVNSGKDYKSLEKGNIPVYGTGGYITSVSKSLSNQDAIGLGRKGTINKPYILKAPFWTVDTLFYLTLKPENILTFIYSLIQKINWLKYDESTGLPSLSKKNIENVLVYLTKLDEQQKIGKLIVKLDKLITLQQRKLEQLKLLEKALQQKLFPNSFQEKPLLRILHGDNSWWNSYIGEVFTERVDKGSSEKLLSVSITDGVYPFDESKRKNNSSDDKHNYKKVFQNDIAYNSMRLWQGALGVSKYEGIVSPAYTVLKPLPNQNSIFYEFMFKNIDMLHIFQRNSQGLTSDTWNLKFNQLQHIKIKTTNLNSQNKIAKLLIKIEELKNNESNYYHNLMTLKKYLLQKLFI